MNFSTDFAHQWVHMSSAERSTYCRRIALEAEKLSSRAEGKEKQAYLRVAFAWLELASEIERGQTAIQ